jgi:hypothetical protein
MSMAKASKPNSVPARVPRLQLFVIEVDEVGVEHVIAGPFSTHARVDSALEAARLAGHSRASVKAEFNALDSG